MSNEEFRRWAEALDPQALVGAFDSLKAERKQLDERVTAAKDSANKRLQRAVAERADIMTREQIMVLVDAVEPEVDALFAESLERGEERFIALLNIGERVAARLNAGPVLTDEDHARLLELGRRGVPLNRYGVGAR